MTALDTVTTDVSIVIVNYRTPHHVLTCLDALADERRRWPSFDVVVIDGGSGDASAETIAAGVAARGLGDWVTVLPLAVNGGFGWANNEAIRRVLARPDAPEFVHLLNPDAIPEPGAVRLLYEALRDDARASCAGSLLVTEDGGAQGSAFDFPTIRSEFARGSGMGVIQRLLGCRPCVVSNETVAADWVTGASVMLRAAALRRVGLFDEGFFLYFEEVELMHRLHRDGWTALHVPASRVVHVGGASTGVVDGASETRRLPSYWFQSRRRCFTLMRGRATAAAASLAWLAGCAIWRLRSAIGVGRRWSGHAPHEASDLLAVGVWPGSVDATRQVPGWSSPTDQPPAWMRAHD